MPVLESRISPKGRGGGNISQETPGRASGNRVGRLHPSQNAHNSPPPPPCWGFHYHLLHREVHIRGMAFTSCTDSPQTASSQSGWPPFLGQQRSLPNSVGESPFLFPTSGPVQTVSLGVGSGSISQRRPPLPSTFPCPFFLQKRVRGLPTRQSHRISTLFTSLAQRKLPVTSSSFEGRSSTSSLVPLSSVY